MYKFLILSVCEQVVEVLGVNFSASVDLEFRVLSEIAVVRLGKWGGYPSSC